MATLDLSPISDVFRHQGYNGASLSMIAEAVGLKRASLYHRFPGGKQEMAEAVLADVREYFLINVVGPLHSNESPADRLIQAIDGIRIFYRDGRKSCLIDVLSLGEPAALFRPYISELIAAWTDAMTVVSRDSGHTEVRARQLAEESLIRIQGALVVSRSMMASDVFTRVLDSLPDHLLA